MTFRKMACILVGLVLILVWCTGCISKSDWLLNKEEKGVVLEQAEESLGETDSEEKMSAESESVSGTTKEEEKKAVKGEEEKAAEEEVGKKQEEVLTAEPHRKMLEILEKELSESFLGIKGNWAVYVMCLDSEEDMTINSASMPAASLIKLFIAGTYLEAVENGDLADTYDTQFRAMLSDSDNNACNFLIDVLTMEKVNDFCKRKDFNDTVLNRKMLEKGKEDNYTSVRDCGKLLQDVYYEEFVSIEASERILEALKNQSRRNKIPAGLPEGVLCANKTGELSYAENDTAIIWTEETDYVLCVMSENISAASEAQQEVADISSLVYQAVIGWNPSLPAKAWEGDGKSSEAPPK